MFAQTPAPPYYSVIFTSQRHAADALGGYDAMAARMVELAAQQPGYLGIESARNSAGFGITVSYWESLAAISAWKANTEHRVAQENGQRHWYAQYELRIGKVERAYSSPGQSGPI